MPRARSSLVLDAERAGAWRRMKACRKESCGWLFYDRSRNRSVNWCSMTICGNRTKTAVTGVGEAGVVRSALSSRARLAAPSAAHRGRGGHGARARGRRRPCSPACSRAYDRDRPLDARRRSSASPCRRVGPGRVVRDPREPSDGSPPRSARRGRLLGLGLAARRRSSSSARAPWRAGSSGSPASTASARTSCCARVGSPARARPRGARCCGSAVAAALPNAPGLRLVEVGTGTLRSTQLFGDFLRSTDARSRTRARARARRSGGYHRPPPGAARRRRGRDRARGVARARTHLSQLRLGLAGRSRPAAPVGDRRLVARHASAPAPS